MTDGERQGPLFWLMVIQASNPMGFSVNSYQGTWTPARGATRLDLFNAIRQHVNDTEPHCRTGVVTAFDIQPNKI